MSAAPVNAGDYTPKQAKKLSVMQRALLQRGLVTYPMSFVLEKHEIPAAMGLERRGLAHTRRPTTGLFTQRSVPGTKRTFRLSIEGHAVAKHIDPPAAVPKKPIDLDEAKRMLRELSAAVLSKAERMPGFVRNRASAVQDRLDEDVD